MASKIPKAYNSRGILNFALILLVAGYAVATAEVERMNDPENFWAYQQLAKSSPPTTQDTHWPSNSIDYFVLAKLEKNQLNPSREASKADLIRRATYDLHGLPPTPEEVDAFLKD
ncbi:MAG: DUF1549 domain-containing protein, partial [Verrucomicrobia bacterium]|nr:DUF1549 domain-containing protein [Verrucomicrobiota bacterium]